MTKRHAIVGAAGFQPTNSNAWKYDEVYLASDVDAHLAAQREELFNEASLHAATQLCLKAQTESVMKCAEKGATLQAELEMFKGIFGEHDASPRTIEQARMMWDTLKAELEGMKQQAAEWGRKGREVCCAYGNLLIEHHELTQQLTTREWLVKELPGELLKEIEKLWLVEYERVLDDQDKKIAYMKQENDMYGWNLHQGLRFGAIEMDLTFGRVLKALTKADA